MTKKRNVEFLGPVCPEHGAPVRDSDGTIGILRPLEEGKPITRGEAVSIGPRNEDGTYPMETLYKAPKVEVEAHNERVANGPAYVATDATRKTWDRLWGSKKNDKAN